MGQNVATHGNMCALKTTHGNVWGICGPSVKTEIVPTPSGTRRHLKSTWLGRSGKDRRDPTTPTPGRPGICGAFSCLYSLQRGGVTWCYIGRFARYMYEETASAVRCDMVFHRVLFVRDISKQSCTSLHKECDHFPSLGLFHLRLHFRVSIRKHFTYIDFRTLWDFRTLCACIPQRPPNQFHLVPNS